MANKFYICKWISFAISTFVILEEIASDNNLKEDINQPPPGKVISLSGADLRLEEVKKEVEAEVQNIARKRVKHTPPPSSKNRKRKGLKNSIRNLKRFKNKGGKYSGGGGSSGGSSGGGGGGY